MKCLAMIVLAIFLVGLFAFVAMAVMSQKQPKNLGLLNGLLRPCPDSPNCVCSDVAEKSDSEHVIQAIHGDQQTWLQLKKVIIAQGGRIEIDANDYIHAEFTSTIFRYVDDVEFRFDRIKKLIHIRSASRVGRSDFGANRKRILIIKEALEQGSL